MAKRGIAEPAFHIDGMDCRACTTNLVRQLARVLGVAIADVDYDADVAIVAHDGTRDPTPELEAIRMLGYRATAITHPSTSRAGSTHSQ